ncbi:GIY-YIG nuclease family protein [Fischerella sp. PCC 9605]
MWLHYVRLEQRLHQKLNHYRCRKNSEWFDSRVLQWLNPISIYSVLR